MNDFLSQTGFAQIGLQGISGPTVNITQILGKSVEYQDLLLQVEREEMLLTLLPETDVEKRLTTSKRINELKTQVEQFKRDVQSLAETFSKIEINTERLRRAKEFFDKGELGESRAVLEIELEQMLDEQKRLIAKKDEYESDTLPKLKHNSEEFLVLAQSKQADYSDPNRFQTTCEYFERSIGSYKTHDNLFRYAFFLYEHKQFNECEIFLEEALQTLRKLSVENPEMYLINVAVTLNNIASLHQNQNKQAEADIEYEEALAIYRELSDSNPENYLRDIALVLNNIATLYFKQKRLAQAEKHYEESLAMYRKLSVSNPEPYLADIAMVLNNIANLHIKQNKLTQVEKHYEESLRIYRDLSVSNPNAYLPDVAAILNNTASFHEKKKKLTQAENEFDEALTIYRKLSMLNPESYLHDVAMALNNIANLHLKQNNLAQTEKELEESLTICRDLSVSNPEAYLPYVAITLNNIAALHAKQNKLNQAEKEYEEALIIRRELSISSPEVYLPDVAVTLVNLAIFYFDSKPEREKSISSANEAIKILEDFVDKAPYTEEDMNSAKEILMEWDKKSKKVALDIMERIKKINFTKINH